MNSSDDPLVTLARRLRGLREEGLGEKSITQRQLAVALSRRDRASVPLISSWESTSTPKVPPQNRLEAYATFFATERSVASEPYRLVDLSDLDATERERRDDLIRELTRLRNAAIHYGTMPSVSDPGGDSLWHFPIGQDVTIICAALPEDLRSRMPYTDPASPDYIKLYGLADLDALLELYGHIRSVNPSNHVNIRTPSEQLADAYTAHLVVLGGVDFNPVTQDLLRRIDLPVRQAPRDEQSDVGGFEVIEESKPRLFAPYVHKTDGSEELLEDVAHFYRGPNPFNKKRTVTICNGMYGRGVLGAVQTLTDPRFRDRNEDYVNQNFAGSDRFSIVSRVYIVSGEVVTPDWTLPEVRLHEWPKEPSEHRSDHREPHQ